MGLMFKLKLTFGQQYVSAFRNVSRLQIITASYILYSHHQGHFRGIYEEKDISYVEVHLNWGGKQDAESQLEFDWGNKIKWNSKKTHLSCEVWMF